MLTKVTFIWICTKMTVVLFFFFLHYHHTCKYVVMKSQPSTRLSVCSSQRPASSSLAHEPPHPHPTHPNWAFWMNSAMTLVGTKSSTLRHISSLAIQSKTTRSQDSCGRQEFVQTVQGLWEGSFFWKGRTNFLENLAFFSAHCCLLLSSCAFSYLELVFTGNIQCPLPTASSPPLPFFFFFFPLCPLANTHLHIPLIHVEKIMLSLPSPFKVETGSAWAPRSSRRLLPSSCSVRVRACLSGRSFNNTEKHLMCLPKQSVCMRVHVLLVCLGCFVKVSTFKDIWPLSALAAN